MAAVFAPFAAAEEADPLDESQYYRLVTYPLPETLKLEASGAAALPDGRLAVAIRKGEVWILENPLLESEHADDYHWTRFASGLHEPIGLTWHDGALYTAQRTEVTRLEDNDKDGVADAYLTAAKGWGVTGNYHEYAYGPAFDAKGNLWLTLNQSMGKGQDVAEQYKDDFRWRGWSMMKPADGGKLRPMSAGLRSPHGIATNTAGDVFATDQQGNWWGTCPILHLKEGAFHGHAEALRDVSRPESPVKDPGDLPKGITTAQAITQVPGYTPPAVWFPYTKIGMSTTALICDQTGGKFGPFEGQFFVGEFTESFVSRAFLEKVNGEYQGACFHFRKGLQCAVVGLGFLPDGSLVIGESNRGWNSLGTRSYGLQRLVPTGRVPFEIQKMEARPDGFRLTFTSPAKPDTAANPISYSMTSYCWKYHSTYGSDEVETQEVKIVSATPSDDGLSVDLVCEGLRAGYCHELHAEGVWSKDGIPLLHPEAFYTLNAIPAL
ncbi:MAG: hypothetical protein KDM63_14620 [Verrucomicrobiae bacterium]|nr:hypothetical protein [Verrucomicrobiae bacterium]